MIPTHPIPLSPRKLLLNALARLDAEDILRALGQGADPRAVSREGYTPLLSLVYASSGPAPTSTPARMACVRALLPVSSLNFTFKHHSWAPSLLGAAIYSAPKGEVDLVHALLDAGAVDAPDVVTPALAMCVIAGRVDLAHELLARGFDSNVRDSRGRNALMLAASSSHIDLVQRLALHSDLLATDAQGRGAVAYAFDNKTSSGPHIHGFLTSLILSTREALSLSTMIPSAPASCSLNGRVSGHAGRL